MTEGFPTIDVMTTERATERRSTASRRRSAVWAGLLAAGVIMTGCASDAPSEGDSTEARVAEAADVMLEKGAVAIVVDVRAGESITQVARGEADLDTGRAPQADDPVRVASITKTAVAAAVLRLVEAGQIDLDDPIDDYLPGLLEDHGEVTVRQLLNHTSGLPDHTAPLFADMESVRAAQTQVFTDADHVAAAVQQDWLAEPGAEFHYSNTNYAVLGMLIADVSGQSTAAFIQSEVFEPAGMTNTSFPEGPQMTDEALRGYLTVDGERLDMTEFEPSVWSWGASMVSTAPDVSAMMQALNGGELLEPDSLEQMRDLGTSGYGLGLLGGADPCDRTTLAFGQRGNGFGYNTFTLASADGSRVVTMTWTGGTEDPGSDPLLPASQEAMNAALGSTCAG